MSLGRVDTVRCINRIKFRTKKRNDEGKLELKEKKTQTQKTQKKGNAMPPAHFMAVVTSLSKKRKRGFCTRASVRFILGSDSGRFLPVTRNEVFTNEGNATLSLSHEALLCTVVSTTTHLIKSC